MPEIPIRYTVYLKRVRIDTIALEVDEQSDHCALMTAGCIAENDKQLEWNPCGTAITVEGLHRS